MDPDKFWQAVVAHESRLWLPDEKQKRIDELLHGLARSLEGILLLRDISLLVLVAGLMMIWHWIGWWIELPWVWHLGLAFWGWCLVRVVVKGIRRQLRLEHLRDNIAVDKQPDDCKSGSV